MHRPALFILFTLYLGFAAPARADATAELNRVLEENAAASAYARVCDDEPVADQLKSSTMMLLAVNGIDPKNVQLGSAKFNDVVRQELARMKRPSNCSTAVQNARERLAFTQRAIASGRRDAAPAQ
jgi:hypothetical protein